MGVIEQACRFGTGKEERGEAVKERSEMLDAGVVPLV